MLGGDAGVARHVVQRVPSEVGLRRNGVARVPQDVDDLDIDGRQSQHSHSTVTAYSQSQSQHSHSTVTAQDADHLDIALDLLRDVSDVPGEPDRLDDLDRALPAL